MKHLFQLSRPMFHLDSKNFLKKIQEKGNLFDLDSWKEFQNTIYQIDVQIDVSQPEMSSYNCVIRMLYQLLFSRNRIDSYCSLRSSHWQPINRNISNSSVISKWDTWPSVWQLWETCGVFSFVSIDIDTEFYLYCGDTLVRLWWLYLTVWP